MRRQVNNVISVLFSWVRLRILKLFHGQRLHIATIERISPNVVFEMERGAKVMLGKRVRIHSGCKIKVRRGAKLVIGDDVHFNYNCILVCRKSITIGAGTEFGPSVYIYDHDHDYKAGLKKQLFKEAPVHIGTNCWIGANALILRGTVLGNGCVVGGGSCLKGQYGANLRILQRKETTTQQIYETTCR